jgi:two-component system response regulator HydG
MLAGSAGSEGTKLGTNGDGHPVDLKDAASHAEYETILNVLKQVKFNKTKAAEMLKIDRKTLYNKMRNYEESNNIKNV